MSLSFTPAELAQPGEIYPFVGPDGTKLFVRVRVFHDKRVTVDFVSKGGKQEAPIPWFFVVFILLPYPEPKVKVTHTLDCGRVFAFQFSHCFEIVHHGEPIFFWSTLADNLVRC